MAAEMYFIIEGRAGVYIKDSKVPIVILNKADYFGEMGIITGKTSTRNVT